MPISFERIKPGDCCTRPLLADSWGFSSYQALAKGIVMPREDNKIILFVTCRHPEDIPRYRAEFKIGRLQWEGPKDHVGEERLLQAAENGDEIHVFYRPRYRWDFTYEGCFVLTSSEIHQDKPSQFSFKRT
jgi:hypothetical protein